MTLIQPNMPAGGVPESLTSRYKIEVRANGKDDSDNLQAALDQLQRQGRGTLELPDPFYVVTKLLTPIKTSFIKIIGNGRGDDGGSIPGTQISYLGPVQASGSLFTVSDVRGITIEDISFNGNFRVNKVFDGNLIYDSYFKNIHINSPRTGGVGLALLNSGSNTWINLSIVAQAAGASTMKLSGTIVANRLDVCRQLFMNINFLYAGDTVDSHGIWCDQCDNNTFIEGLVLANGAIMKPVGKGIHIDQMGEPDDYFNHENLFINIATSGVSGTGGKGGNWFLPYPTSDGSDLPTGDFFHALAYDGKIWNGDKQRRTLRQILNVKATASATTVSNTYILVTGMSQAITTKAGKLKLTFTGRAGKNVGGSGYFQLYVDGTGLGGVTQREVFASGAFNHSVSMVAIVDVPEGAHTVELRYRSGDANSVEVLERELIVEELY